MISILIPIYNFDVTAMAGELSKQSTLLTCPIEILCIDDGSTLAFKTTNSKLLSLSNVQYLELEKNIGRSAIRNFLASQAKYDYLIFLDSDAQIISSTFLSSYLSVLPTHEVWMGGRVYQKNPPKDSTLFLHWHYGTKRESKPACIRRVNPFHSFMTNNFLLSKKIFFDVPLDEEIKGYGHEDTLWGFSLRKNGININHIDNEVLHLGLEDRNVFLAKSYEAVRNLAQLFLQKKDISSKLLTTYLFLKKWHLIGLYSRVIDFLKPKFEKNVLSNAPKLFYLDLLKLHQFINYLK